MSSGRQLGPTALLVDLLPGLDARLTEAERCRVSSLQVPVRTAFPGSFYLEEALRRSRAFAIVIADGMMLRTIRMGEHSSLQLLGPGDLVGRPGENGSELIASGALQASDIVRYAPLDDRLLAVARRYPRVIEGLHMCGADRQKRLLAHLLICQLPRVDDRILGLMWLLAETWGRVTPSGTVLPIRLTHDVVGQLVGARRSTVTLAIKALEERGALVRRAGDWLILERPQPPSGAESAEDVEPSGSLPRLTPGESHSPWADAGRRAAAEHRCSNVAWLRLRHSRTLEESRARIATATAISGRSRSLLQEISERRSGRCGLHHEDDAGDLPVGLGTAER